MGWGGASQGPKWQGWGKKIFPIMQGWGGVGDGAKQNHAGLEQGQRPHPLAQPHPSAIPSTPMNCPILTPN